jgi:Zn-dependent protease
MTIKARVPVHISAYFVGMAALCLAAGPLWRMGLALGFAALHEAGHLLAMALCGVRPSRICLTAAGVRIERPPALTLTFAQEIAIASAGPAVSLLLAGLFALLQRVIPCPLPPDPCLLNLGFGLFNLLPVRQLDGGRALYFLLCKRFSERAASRAILAASLLCLFAAAVGAALVCLRQGISLPLLVAVAYLAACC